MLKLAKLRLKKVKNKNNKLKPKKQNGDNIYVKYKYINLYIKLLLSLMSNTFKSAGNTLAKGDLA
jgi:hypothetical protein